MITFGYKNKFSSTLRALSAFGIGLVMVISNEATTTVVKVIAGLLFATGLVSILYGLMQKDKSSMPLFSFNAIVDCVLGAVMFFWPTFISNIIVYVIGGLLILLGIMQLIVMVSTMSLVGRSTFSLILSIVAIVGGLVLVFNPFSMRLMSIIAGILLIVYAISELLSEWRVRKAVEVFEVNMKEDENIDKPSYTDYESIIKDVEYEKVSDDVDVDEQ